MGDGSKLDRPAAGHDEHREARRLDRVVAGGAEGHLAGGRLGARADDEQIDVAGAGALGNRGAKRRGEALGGLTGSRIALVDDPDRVDADRGVVAQPGRGDGDRRRAAEQQLVGGNARLDRAGRGAVLGAENDHVGILALGQFGEANAGAGVDDDVAWHVRRANRFGAAGEQVLSLLLLQRATLGVADVGEREIGAAEGEQAAERERVAIVVGVVIGNDDASGHRGSP